MMVHLRHPNIVAFLGGCLNPPDIFIVTEYMERGDLFSILNNPNIIIEEFHKRKFTLDTVKGMTYLHSKNIIHRDLKTYNLLVDKDWDVKVGDFGLAKVIEDDSSRMTVCGTTAWAAPEVLKEQHYTIKADVYSFGICFWEICTRQEPFKNMKPSQVVLAIVNEKLRPEIPSDIRKEYVSIIEACWDEIPEDRPSFAGLVEELEYIQAPDPKSPSPYYLQPDTSNTINL
uniref:Protein kinase domain-containing protein n=1 Tax=Arcella intermedia TaxID=1963864 RepID=A0A6B2LD35_9EUKA